MYYVSSAVGNRHMCGVRIDGDVKSTEQNVMAVAIPIISPRIDITQAVFKICAVFTDPRGKVKQSGTINIAIEHLSSFIIKLLKLLSLMPNDKRPKWWHHSLETFYVDNDNSRRQVTHLATMVMLCASSGAVEIDYVNYAGKREWRLITMRWPPRYGTSKHHPDHQWLIDAYCHIRDDRRTFAMTDILGWRKPL